MYTVSCSQEDHAMQFSVDSVCWRWISYGLLYCHWQLVCYWFINGTRLFLPKTDDLPKESLFTYNWEILVKNFC